MMAVKGNSRKEDMREVRDSFRVRRMGSVGSRFRCPSVTGA